MLPVRDSAENAVNKNRKKLASNLTEFVLLPARFFGVFAEIRFNKTGFRFLPDQANEKYSQ